MHFRNLSRPPLHRMLRIHEELKRRAPVNCTLLAKALEVSEKTIARDIAFMIDELNLPIDYDETHWTWRYTRPVEAFPTMQVTEGEVVALLIGRKALDQYRGTPFFRQLAASFEKIAAALPGKIAFRASEALQAISFKTTGTGRGDLPTFNLLSRALLREVEVEFDYRKPGETAITARRVRPYQFVHHENFWYLIGFDLTRGDLRTFALTRITRARVTPAAFERPADFSPEKFLASAFGMLGGDGDYRIIVRFDPIVADRIREREWHTSEQMRDQPGGGLDYEVRLGALPEIERWILSWGAHAEVLEPKELRDRMRETANALGKTYAA